MEEEDRRWPGACVTISSKIGFFSGGVLAVKPTHSPSVRGWKKGEASMYEEKQQAGKSVFAAPPLFFPSFGFLVSKRLDPPPFRSGKVTPTSHQTTTISLPRDLLQ